MKRLLIFALVFASIPAFAQSSTEDYCVNPDRKVYFLKHRVDSVKKANQKISKIIPREDIGIGELIAELEDGTAILVPCSGVRGVSKNRPSIDALIIKQSNIFSIVKNIVPGKMGMDGTSVTAVGINHETSQVLVEYVFLLVNKRYRLVDVDLKK